MPVDGPDQWTATLRDEGRLVVPPRRDKLTLTLVVAGGILLINGVRSIGHLSSGAPWGWYDYVRVLLALFAAIALVLVANNLRTNHWTLTVDAEGVTLGSQHLAWPEIAQITSAKQQVILHPTPGAEELRITNNTVRDPTTFAAWLIAQHQR